MEHLGEITVEHFAGTPDSRDEEPAAVAWIRLDGRAVAVCEIMPEDARIGFLSRKTIGLKLTPAEQIGIATAARPLLAELRNRLADELAALREAIG